jgi:hypothetical protein
MTRRGPCDAAYRRPQPHSGPQRPLSDVGMTRDGLVADRTEVGQAVTAAGEHDRQIAGSRGRGRRRGRSWPHGAVVARTGRCALTGPSRAAVGRVTGSPAQRSQARARARRRTRARARPPRLAPDRPCSMRALSPGRHGCRRVPTCLDAAYAIGSRSRLSQCRCVPTGPPGAGTSINDRCGSAALGLPYARRNSTDHGRRDGGSAVVRTRLTAGGVVRRLPWQPRRIGGSGGAVPSGERRPGSSLHRGAAAPAAGGLAPL